MQELREGGIDGRGAFVEYVFERRREQGWVHRIWKDGLVQIETFSGDYRVMHHVRRSDVRHVFTDAEIAEAMRRA